MSGRESLDSLRYRGVSLWRDRHDAGHWVLVLFGRRYLHFYARGLRFFWIEARGHHLNWGCPEFKRVPW